MRTGLSFAHPHMSAAHEPWMDGSVTPQSLFGSALILWLRSDLGVTAVMGPVTAAGTTPPAVTLTGTPNASAYNTSIGTASIEIDITTGGARGTALFTWKLNGVVQQTGQTTAATFALGTTGVTANFPTGTYTNNNVYTANTTVSAWADNTATGANVTQATSTLQPVYVGSGGGGGQPYIASVSGATTLLKHATLPSIAQGTEQFAVARANVASGGRYILDRGPTTNNNTLVQQTGPIMQYYPASANANFSTNVDHIVDAVEPASGNGTIAVDGASAITGSAGPAGTTTGISIGNRFDGPASGWGGNIYEIIALNRLATAAERLAITRYAGARYGISVP